MSNGLSVRRSWIAYHKRKFRIFYSQHVDDVIQGNMEALLTLISPPSFLIKSKQYSKFSQVGYTHEKTFDMILTDFHSKTDMNLLNNFGAYVMTGNKSIDLSSAGFNDLKIYNTYGDQLLFTVYKPKIADIKNLVLSTENIMIAVKHNTSEGVEGSKEFRMIRQNIKSSRNAEVLSSIVVAKLNERIENRAYELEKKQLIKDLFRIFTQVEYLYERPGDKIIVHKRKRPPNVFVHSPTDNRILNTLYFYIPEPTPIYKNPNLMRQYFLEGGWLENITGKDLPVDFSTKNSHSRVVDYIDGLIISKYEVAQMKKSLFTVPTAITSHQVSYLPDASYYIVKPADWMDMGKFQIFENKEAVKKEMEKACPRCKLVAQPMIENARNYKGEGALVSIKRYVLFSCRANSKPLIWIRRGGEGVYQKTTEDEKTIKDLPVVWSTDVYAKYGKYTDHAFEKYIELQSRLLPVSEKDAYVIVSIEFIPSPDPEKFYLLEINKQCGIEVAFSENMETKSDANFLYSLIGGIGEAIHGLASDSELRMTKDWQLY